MDAIVAPQCPRCGGELLAIAWGYPDDETLEAGMRGELHIGGCVLPASTPPAWHCPACKQHIADEDLDE